MARLFIATSPIWDDIKSFPVEHFISGVDIIYGGFPCQGISIAGLGKGLEDERSGLFFEIVRLAKEIRPRFIFLENVPAISVRGGTQVVKEIADLGYDCRWCTLSASTCKSPQKRARWFMLAYNNSKPSREAHKETKSFESAKETRLRPSGQDWRETCRTYWEENQCPVYGMDDGLSFELDRARALGNSVCPQQTKQAFEILMGITPAHP